GALPTVSAGKLKDDLIRRDFSINALAIDVMTGEMLDPTGGARDLEARIIRVLHDESFADDPTRIFRAIRLCIRLGFTLEEHSAGLLRAALENGAMATIAKERVWRELFLAFDEADAPATVVALNDAGALDVLFSRRPADPKLPSRLQRARAAIEAAVTQ